MTSAVLFVVPQELAFEDNHGVVLGAAALLMWRNLPEAVRIATSDGLLDGAIAGRRKRRESAVLRSCGCTAMHITAPGDSSMNRR
jgi:hypothetical protein